MNDIVDTWIGVVVEEHKAESERDEKTNAASNIYNKIVDSELSE